MSNKKWVRVLQHGELPEGRVTSVTCGLKTLCLTHHAGAYGALDNHCPHQGGPLGEGTIENGLLRCPWHGWDYDPITGKAPGFDDGVDTFEMETREDGIYVCIPQEAEHERTVSDVMMETLVAWGVKHVWGMVGHSNLGLAEAVRQQERADNISYYGIRHEGAASFAASAYGKLTGRPAACLAIAGPGATNLLTGLWDAHVDRSPTIALTGQVDTQVLGPGAFQEVDLNGAFGRVAVWSQTVLPGSRHAELATLAAKNAILERGVSHLIFPDEVQTIPAARADAPPSGPGGRLADRRVRPARAIIQAAAERVARAGRPVIVVGHGARFHMEQVISLAERLEAPVLTTFKAKGQISDTHPLAGGVLGRSGTPVASWVMNESDLLIVIGASFSNHTGIASKIDTIQIDFEPMALGRFHAVSLPVLGEIGESLADLAAELDKSHADHEPTSDQRRDLAKRHALWQTEKARRRSDDQSSGLSSSHVFDVLSRLVPADAIIPVDVGNNTYSFGRYFECREQTVLMSGYLGSIGFSLPAAMGAWAATQESDTPFAGRKVVSISGDGGFGQYMGEFTTLVKYNMNITHILLNNSELGKISKEQRSGEWAVWETDLVNPSFAKYAHLCGAMGIHVEEPRALEKAVRAALEHDGPSLVEIRTNALLV